VPAKLEPIATIERNRVTDGKFPILIDWSGPIVSAGEAELTSDVDRAIEVAQQMAARNGASTTALRTGARSLCLTGAAECSK